MIQHFQNIIKKLFKLSIFTGITFMTVHGNIYHNITLIYITNFYIIGIG